MEPLHLLMHRVSDYSAAHGSWFSIILASCLAPLILNLVSSQVQACLSKLKHLINERIQRYEYVLVPCDRKPRNDLYWYVSLFLNSKAEGVGVSKNAKMNYPLSNVVVFGLESGQRVSDSFEGMEVEWEFVRTDRENKTEMMSEYYRLKVHKKHRHLQRRYLLHIAQTVQQLEQGEKMRSLFTFTGGAGDVRWESYVFKHPSTFESLAMDSDLKTRIKSDLNDFVRSQEYYESVGKPWKRGYLLYGPPGTGKSSLIAAIANYLSFDVYDLDLSGVGSNAELRSLLLQTRNRSVIVIEDIDCCFSAALEARTSRGMEDHHKDGRPGDYKTAEAGVTLSGMLNFCDGLWSGSGNERVFIFTTNHVENLDPALLRKGRMDLHICMSYCKFDAMKTLVANYLKVNDEEPELMSKIETLLEEVNVTPADVAEVLLSSRKDPRLALRKVIRLLKERKDRKPEEEEDEDEDEAERGGRKVSKGGPLSSSRSALSGPPKGPPRYRNKGRFIPKYEIKQETKDMF